MTGLIVDNFAGPLAVDICCGLGGWTEGLLAEGWRVRGYDIEEHVYGDERYPAELVIRNVLEMHGSEIADAELIVASPTATDCWVMYGAVAKTSIWFERAVYPGGT